MRGDRGWERNIVFCWALYAGTCVLCKTLLIYMQFSCDSLDIPPRVSRFHFHVSFFLLIPLACHLSPFFRSLRGIQSRTVLSSIFLLIQDTIPTIASRVTGLVWKHCDSFADDFFAANPRRVVSLLHAASRFRRWVKKNKKIALSRVFVSFVLRRF